MAASLSFLIRSSGLAVPHQDLTLPRPARAWDTPLLTPHLAQHRSCPCIQVLEDEMMVVPGSTERVHACPRDGDIFMPQVCSRSDCPL